MKRLISVVALIFLFVSVSQSQHSFTSSDAKKFVESFKESGLIKRVDYNKNRVYVWHNLWKYDMDAKKKEMFVCLIADYFKYHNPAWGMDVRPEAEIYSNRTAKRLAYWSNWSGINIE